MDDPAKTIAVVRGGSTADVEQTFRTLVDHWRPTVRLAGLIAESHELADRACNAGFLRNIATAERFSIFQDLGPGSIECHLYGAGALTAAGAVRRDIAAGCELVLLNKFGKLEAAGEDLASAFKAALDARIPLLTSVSPALEEAWKRFTGRPFTILHADPIEIDAAEHRARRTRFASLRAITRNPSCSHRRIGWCARRLDGGAPNAPVLCKAPFRDGFLLAPRGRFIRPFCDRQHSSSILLAGKCVSFLRVHLSVHNITGCPMFAALVQALPYVLSAALCIFLLYGFWRGLTLRPHEREHRPPPLSRYFWWAND
jgi:hypothetical protein